MRRRPSPAILLIDPKSYDAYLIENARFVAANVLAGRLGRREIVAGVEEGYRPIALRVGKKIYAQVYPVVPVAHFGNISIAAHVGLRELGEISTKLPKDIETIDELIDKVVDTVDALAASPTVERGEDTVVGRARDIIRAARLVGEMSAKALRSATIGMALSNVIGRNVAKQLEAQAKLEAARRSPLLALGMFAFMILALLILAAFGILK